MWQPHPPYRRTCILCANKLLSKNLTFLFRSHEFKHKYEKTTDTRVPSKHLLHNAEGESGTPVWGGQTVERLICPETITSQLADVFFFYTLVTCWVRGFLLSPLLLYSPQGQKQIIKWTQFFSVISNKSCAKVHAVQKCPLVHI